VTKDAFNDDRRVRQLVERNIKIISEASRSIPPSLKQRYPEIEWQDMAGIGSILRHDYDGIEADILWDVVRRDLAPLKRVVRRMLKALDAK
jgi:uncharacterized protein with HEPN domain